MLNGGETTGADVLVASLGADSRLLEPLALCARHMFLARWPAVLPG